MAIDSNGKTYENRTLQFYGIAYGDSNVSLTATINGIAAFSGEVPTINSTTPSQPPEPMSVLFSIDNSTLFPTNWSGSYPMSITVTGGYSAVFGKINCNYMATISNIITTTMENSSISDNVLTVGTVSSGNMVINQLLTGTDIVANTIIMSGSDRTWIVNNSQTVPNTTITGIILDKNPGTANGYSQCYNGIPVNSEGTHDPRSSVVIDGVPHSPPTDGVWTWLVQTGSTISYNLNVSLGNCAQS